MMRRTILALALLATARVGLAQKPFGEQALLQIADEWRCAGVVHEDVDGDGLADLVCGVYGRDDAWRHELRVHRQSAKSFAFDQTPVHTLELPRDVVAWAVGDFLPDPGREIALFSPRTAVIWRPTKKERERFQRVGPCDFLWQSPDDDALLALQDLVVDVDGDGVDELLIPEPAAYRLYRAETGAEGTTFRGTRLDLPPEPRREEGLDAAGVRARSSVGSVKLSLSIPGIERNRYGLERRPPLLELEERVPRPRLVDFDGDGRLDVVARGEATLWVWRQGERGAFTSAPTSAQPTPVLADRSRLIDVSFGSHFHDLDGDRRCDAVVIAGDQRAEEPRAQVMIYLQGKGSKEDPRGADVPLFGRRGLPDQLLVLLGFVIAAELVDVDGDGFRDLAATVLAGGGTSLLGSDDGGVEVELYVFRNRRGVFSKTPQLRKSITLDSRLGGVGRRPMSFFADVTGDGVRELVVPNGIGSPSVYLTKAAKDELRVFHQPLATIVHDDARFVWGEHPRPWIMGSTVTRITVQRY